MEYGTRLAWLRTPFCPGKTLAKPKPKYQPLIGMWVVAVGHSAQRTAHS
jgi:hypothetical protein